MPKNIKQLICLSAALAMMSAVPAIHTQVPGGTQSMGSSQMGPGQTGSPQSTGGFKNPDDAISSIAPPFDLEDVQRMHRVGLSDEVIVNALRGRYHPLILTDSDRATLQKGGLSDRVIVAVEDPYGIGIENVRDNIKAADSVAPPVAQTPQQAEKADPNAPKLKTRPVSDIPPSAPEAQPSDVYVGRSDPPAESISTSNTATTPKPNTSSVTNGTSTPSDVTATVPRVADETASLDVGKNLVSDIPPAPVTKIVSKPIGIGVFLRHGSNWERVGGEPVYWHHHGDKNVEGSVLRPESSTQTYPGGTDFLIITANNTSAIQYQLVRLKTEEDKRTFKPAAADGVYTAGGGDLEHFDPQKLGPSSWLISVHDLPAGEYGFLPPVTEQVRSTTNLATTLFTFRIK